MFRILGIDSLSMKEFYLLSNLYRKNCFVTWFKFEMYEEKRNLISSETNPFCDNKW